jgi:VWFA-related protein
LIALALLCGAQLPSMQNPLVLRTNTRVVEINVSVRDAQGKAITDLGKVDFSVTDDGKPRAFTIFTNNSTGAVAAASVAAPATLPERPVLPPHTFTNVGEPPPRVQTHSTIILLDAMNGWFENFAWAQKGVIGMLEKVPQDEKIALYVITREGLGTLEDYTTDRAKLLASMKNYVVRGMPPAPSGMEDVGEAMTETGPIRFVGTLQDDGGDSAQKSLAQRKAAMAQDRSRPARMQLAADSVRLSLKALAEKLRNQPGRKSVFWMTQGFPPALLRGEFATPWNNTISALNDANVQVNTIDTNGLGGPHRYWGPGAILSMQQIAQDTGGKAYYHRNDLDGALSEGIADSRSSYTLGFYLTEVDGNYHALKVRVDRPGVSLNYRQGYFAVDEPKIDSSQKKLELSAALLNPADSTGVGIVASLELQPAKPRDQLAVRLRLDPDSLTMHESKAGRSGKVEEMFVEFNAAGREVGRITAASPFDITPENSDAFEKTGVTMVQSIPLSAEAVKLSIIVRDTDSGRVGSLTVPIEK